ncbi:MAG: nodulation protein NodN [Rickettsiales bacterium]|nr:nodulation protein NodN [Rickettsiales bacterium]|tara:strand:+ start:1168 stop:1674 length:507 start_codon:yes stop_codon:yes gene_type:complete
MTARYTVEQMIERIGSEIGVSDWMTVEQEVIDDFGRSTKDLDWMHIDPVRASREGPYGGTIAFGFWSLSMLTYFSHQIGMWPKDVAYGLNYGLEKVRWLNPVRVGCRIRQRCTLTDLERRDDGYVSIRTTNVLEIEGEERPALIADWLGLFVQENSDSGFRSQEKDRE